MGRLDEYSAEERKSMGLETYEEMMARIEREEAERNARFTAWFRSHGIEP